MARMVLHEEHGPVEVEGKWICRCGLSKNQPFCDGSHNKTKDEEAGRIYKYQEDGSREEV